MRLTDLLLQTLLAASALAAQPKNSVLLSKVKTLTLRDGLKTSHRRVSAVPQLKCVGGTAKGLYDVDVMRCKNSGSDYDDDNIQWTCEASLPEEFKLGSTDVLCEGYSSSEDPYILKGSCGVEYRLMLTEKGEEKYGNRRGGNRRPNSGEKGGSQTPNPGEKADGAFQVFFWILFIGVVGWMLYAAFVRDQVHRRRPAATQTGNGGFYGGGGDDNNDPPPPYTPRSPYTPRAAAPKSSANKSSTSTRSSSNRSSSNQQSGPGFWSGAAAGAAAGGAAGYYMGNRSNTQTHEDPYQYQDHYGTNTGGSWFGRGSRTPERGNGGGSWFGSGSGGRTDNGRSSGGESSTRNSSSSSTSSSSARYTSTGFGSTTRR